MTIFLAGGGSGGPTTPLLAVATELKKQKKDVEIFFIGNNRRLDQPFLQDFGSPVKYLSLPAGKWRRYFSLLNLTDLLRTFFGFWKALYLLKRYQPDIVIGAGSFVQVPLAWAAFFRKIPVLVHQPDLPILLSTRLVVPVAKVITVSFNLSGKELPASSGLFKRGGKDRVIWTGNPVRREILHGSREQARQIFGLAGGRPVLLVMGGARGARRINETVAAALPELLRYVEVIHATGGKSSARLAREQLPSTLAGRYHDFQFLGEKLPHAYAAADLVLGRGGMATIAELSTLGKPAILVPLAGPQEENVRLLAFLKAAVGVREEYLEPKFLVRLVRKILWSREIQETLRENISRLMPHDADRKIAKLIVKICEEHQPTN
ncbi:MAG: UDP-N-acetylglucosamine--N-acetylmuramyl-(pentapeptide) pyrophosphoryl-undecaprenol N-acetylglucosamine transferase [Candidatus Doudnabacteria bacterium]|nr:UDP-N-acetylglucosamine--N-acetylmuramyl-(pentapeptide) pyrophosphoryl-undecaprenol N-acetylglucosamine transferase [Candidatus Doudnabacteria bacterium]